jgi:hypothetical protein
MDALRAVRRALYGYDTLDVRSSALDRRGHRPDAVSFTEKPGPLPTADEIEARYDHSRTRTRSSSERRRRRGARDRSSCAPRRTTCRPMRSATAMRAAWPEAEKCEAHARSPR